METGIPQPLLHDSTSLPLLQERSRPTLPWPRKNLGNVSVPSSWNKGSQEAAPITFSCSEVSEDGRLHKSLGMILLSLLLLVILAETI